METGFGQWSPWQPARVQCHLEVVLRAVKQAPAVRLVHRADEEGLHDGGVEEVLRLRAVRLHHEAVRPAPRLVLRGCAGASLPRRLRLMCELVNKLMTVVNFTKANGQFHVSEVTKPTRRFWTFLSFRFSYSFASNDSQITMHLKFRLR